MRISLTWDGDERFIAENEKGVKVTMEPGPAYGGSGKYPTPMELVAVALGGCTGMDMAEILKKMRVDLKKFEIEVLPKRREEVPRYFEEIRIVYTISGEGLTQDKAQRAADLSNQKYCSVGVMMRDKTKITYEVRIE